MPTEKTPRHKHYWSYPHSIISGRRVGDVVIVRYCGCGLRQMAAVSKWQRARGDYARDEHYD